MGEIILTRRSFFAGLGAALAAPAVIRSGILMPLRGIAMEDVQPKPIWSVPCDGGYLYSDELADVIATFEEAEKQLRGVTGIERFVASRLRRIVGALRTVESEMIPA